jgi:hypothetical protein
LDAGVFGSTVVREVPYFSKAIAQEGLQGGKGGKHEVEQPQHIHDPGIQQEPPSDSNHEILVVKE